MDMFQHFEWKIKIIWGWKATKIIDLDLEWINGWIKGLMNEWLPGKGDEW